MRPAIDAHIEPCPVCGGRVAYYEDHSGMLGCAGRGHCDYGMVYEDEKSIEIHNRISRIVSAAEEYVKTDEDYPGVENGVAQMYKARKALIDAVKGGDNA